MRELLRTRLIPPFSKTPIKTIIGYEDIDGLGTIEHSVLGCRPLTSEEIEEEKQRMKKYQPIKYSPVDFKPIKNKEIQTVKNKETFLSGWFLGVLSGILLGIVIGFYFM